MLRRKNIVAVEKYPFLNKNRGTLVILLQEIDNTVCNSIRINVWFFCVSSKQNILIKSSETNTRIL